MRSSKNMIAVTITHGKMERRIMTVPEVSKAQENPIRILRSA
jgi:hypothetical protein